MTSIGERKRAYHVMMYGISEENRIMHLPDDELRRRMKEAWDSCFGDMSPKGQQARFSIAATTKE